MRQFHQVLRAVIFLHEMLFKQPNGLACPPEVRNNSRFWLYFKVNIFCKLIRVICFVSIILIESKCLCIELYCCPWWHTYSCQSEKWYWATIQGHNISNSKCSVLATCAFHLKFIYVLASWEGVASDLKILDNELRREVDKLLIPRGNNTFIVYLILTIFFNIYWYFSPLILVITI